MNLYILYDKNAGQEIVYTENDNISCKEFEELMGLLIEENGEDIFILKEELIKRGFKPVKIKCFYNIRD